MLDVFIDIVITGNLQLLIKEGSAPEEVLIEKWNDIHLSYCDAIGNNKYTLGVRLATEMSIIDSKCTLVACCGQLLMQGFHEEIAKMLVTYGLSIIYIEDEEKYLEQFKRLESKLKAWKLDYGIKEKEYEKLAGGAVKGKADRSHFDSLLIDLSSYLSYPIKENETSVAKFGLMINKMHKHYETLRNKSNGNGKD